MINCWKSNIIYRIIPKQFNKVYFSCVYVYLYLIDSIKYQFFNLFINIEKKQKRFSTSCLLIKVLINVRARKKKIYVVCVAWSCRSLVCLYHWWLYSLDWLVVRYIDIDYLDKWVERREHVSSDYVSWGKEKLIIETMLGQTRKMSFFLTMYTFVVTIDLLTMRERFFFLFLSVLLENTREEIEKIINDSLSFLSMIKRCGWTRIKREEKTEKKQQQLK